MGVKIVYVGGVADGVIEEEDVDTRLDFIYKTVCIIPFDYIKPVTHRYRISSYIDDFGRLNAFFQPEST